MKTLSNTDAELKKETYQKKVCTEQLLRYFALNLSNFG